MVKCDKICFVSKSANKTFPETWVCNVNVNTSMNINQLCISVFMRLPYCSVAVDFTRSALIPQPHLSSHELMSWNRVQPSLELFLLVLSVALYHISRSNTTAGKRYCQGSKTTIGWALMIQKYISAIIPTQAEVTESRIWWHQWCCLR